MSSKGTKPEGEGSVNRRWQTTAGQPEFYETVVERAPASWNLPDALAQAIESPLGFEVVPGQDPNAVRVRIRCPYKNYLKAVKEGEKKSEDRRRVKTPGAVVDETKRVGIDLQELIEGKEPES